MELSKRKYKKQEVEAMMNAYKAQYEKIIGEQKSIISELTKELDATKKENEGFKQRERLIITTLERAEKNASELEQSVQMQYSLEMQNLKDIVNALEDYFDELQKTYPQYPTVQKAIKIKDIIKDSEDTKATFQMINEILEKNGKNFNPKQKIGEYIAATEDNGFNLNDVLNPGKLELEDLCKELGLIEETE